MDGGRWERFEALVDTGSSYTAIPRDVLSRLGVRPRFRRRFRMADERVIEREVGSALARLDGQEVPTLIVFAEEGVTSTIGRVTLAEFSVDVSDSGDKLIPVRPLAR
jgi:predicted aspartyl protease